VNRKVLADLAVRDAAAFGALVRQAKAQLAEQSGGAAAPAGRDDEVVIGG
jgi:hypothetical protein